MKKSMFITKIVVYAPIENQIKIWCGDKEVTNAMEKKDAMAN